MRKFISFLIAILLLLPIAAHAKSNIKTLGLKQKNFDKSFLGLGEVNNEISIFYTTSVSFEDDVKVLSFDGYLQIGNQKIRINAKGEYSEYFSSSKSKTISIPLLGFMIVNDRKYNIIVGYDYYLKMENITVSFNDHGNHKYMIFGEGVIPVDFYNETNSIVEDDSQSVSSRMIAPPLDGGGGDWSYVSYTDADFYRDGKYTRGLLATLYTEKSNNYIMISARTFTDNVNSLYGPLVPVSHTIYELEYTLKVTQGYGGISNTDPHEGELGSSVSWRDLLSDLFDYCKLPSWTINSILLSAKGGIYRSLGMFETTVKFRGNIDANYYLPVIYLVESNSSNTVRGYYKVRALYKSTSMIMGSVVSTYKDVTTPLKYYSVTMPK